MLKVYFKANCATCQSALKLMRDNTKEKFVKTEYLVEVPTEAEIKEILTMLGMKAEDLVRKKEPLYKEKYEGKKPMSNAASMRIPANRLACKLHATGLQV